MIAIWCLIFFLSVVMISIEAKLHIIMGGHLSIIFIATVICVFGLASFPIVASHMYCIISCWVAIIISRAINM